MQHDMLKCLYDKAIYKHAYFDQSLVTLRYNMLLPGFTEYDNIIYKGIRKKSQGANLDFFMFFTLIFGDNISIFYVFHIEFSDNILIFNFSKLCLR